MCVCVLTALGAAVWRRGARARAARRAARAAAASARAPRSGPPPRTRSVNKRYTFSAMTADWNLLFFVP